MFSLLIFVRFVGAVSYSDEGSDWKKGKREEKADSSSFAFKGVRVWWLKGLGGMGE